MECKKRDYFLKKKTDYYEKNVGSTDRYIRIMPGIIIIAAGIYFNSWWGILAAIPLVTAFTGLCPLYKLLGVNTGNA